MQELDFHIDVTEAAGLGEPAAIAVTVHLPDPALLSDRPILCFAKPGGGYSRRYYTLDLPGPARGAQAVWHAQRGWIFVSVDHLNVGDSSRHDGASLGRAVVAAANHAAEQEVLRRLVAGTLAEGYPSVTPLCVGIGQSFGGHITVVQQAYHRSYDGIALLGYSAVHTHPPVAPGSTPFALPWFSRDDQIVLNRDAIRAAPRPTDTQAIAWGFHYLEDMDPEVAAADARRFVPDLEHPRQYWDPDPPPWASLTHHFATTRSVLTPGVIASEAASVLVPVLCAMGERDVIADPRGETRAFLSATSIDMFICPRMGHMHNFAATRALFWLRIENWAHWVRERAVACSQHR